MPSGGYIKTPSRPRGISHPHTWENDKDREKINLPPEIYFFCPSFSQSPPSAPASSMAWAFGLDVLPLIFAGIFYSCLLSLFTFLLHVMPSFPRCCCCWCRLGPCHSIVT